MQENKEEEKQNVSHVKVCRTNGKQVLIRRNGIGKIIKYGSYKHEEYNLPPFFNILRYKEKLLQKRTQAHIKGAEIVLQSLAFAGITLKIKNYKSISGFCPSNQ